MDDLIGHEPLLAEKCFPLPDGEVLVVLKSRPVSASEIASLYSEETPQWLKDERKSAEQEGN